MTLTDWVAISQIIFNFISVFAAIAAVIVYGRNSRLERSRWVSSLYEKFYERPELKKYVTY